MEPQCARCPAKSCRLPEEKRTPYPAYCPIENFPALMENLKEKYKDSTIYNFYFYSAATEKECYDRTAAQRGEIQPLRPRIREIVEFAKKIEAKKIGLAFCSGLADEGARVNSIFEKHGLKVVSAACSCGAIDKEEVGIPPELKIYGNFQYEPACNPLFQAELLNHAGTSFNVLVGLCVGHDMLFTEHSQAPVTTLIVKDRLTGHNPAISLYTRYHKDLV